MKQKSILLCFSLVIVVLAIWGWHIVGEKRKEEREVALKLTELRRVIQANSQAADALVHKMDQLIERNEQAIITESAFETMEPVNEQQRQAIYHAFRQQRLQVIPIKQPELVTTIWSLVLTETGYVAALTDEQERAEMLLKQIKGRGSMKQQRQQKKVMKALKLVNEQLLIVDEQMEVHQIQLIEKSAVLRNDVEAIIQQLL